MRRPAGARWASKDFAQANDKHKKRDDDGSGMPLLLTATDGSTLLVSPLLDFFTSAQTASKAVGNFSFGIQGTVENVPKGHVHYTLLVAGEGVRSTAFRWGELMMQASGGGKTRSMHWTQSGDVSLRSLSYYTDNGAYYYYQVRCCCQQTRRCHMLICTCTDATLTSHIDYTFRQPTTRARALPPTRLTSARGTLCPKTRAGTSRPYARSLP